jgi:hypothetical protein
LSEYVAEAGHWYGKDGKPAYTQITASGKNKGNERPTTIRDARKLSLLPSVTTICSILDKPALTHWKIKHALKSKMWEVYQWVVSSRCPQLAPAFKMMFKIEQPSDADAAKRGSEIHAALERYLQGGGFDTEFQPYIRILQFVLDDLEINLTDEMHPERSFASELGYGGAVDLPVYVGDGIIIDFKTKDMDADKAAKGLVYDEHITQLAAYRMGLGLPKARLINLFLSRDNPNVYALHEWSEEDAQWGEKMFLSTFNTWKLMKRYEPNGA